MKHSNKEQLLSTVVACYAKVRISSYASILQTLRRHHCNTLLLTRREYSRTNNAILQPYGLESSRRTACRNKVQIIFPPNGNSIGNFYPNKGSLLRWIPSTGGGTQESIVIYFFGSFTLRPYKFPKCYNY